MCDPVSIIAGATVVSGVMNYKAGHDAADAQDAANAQQAKLNKEHAANIKEQAKQEADKIRSEAIVIRGKQVAQQASSGVLVGNGSTQAMVDETTRLAEQDAYITLYNGEKGYLKTMEEGRLMAMEGRARSESYRAQGTASLLSGISAGATNAYLMK